MYHYKWVTFSQEIPQVSLSAALLSSILMAYGLVNR